MLKRIFIIGLVVISLISCQSNKKQPPAVAANDPSLESRLNEYMKSNQDLNFERMMDYIYPKLFEIAPKEDMIKAMNSFFDSKEMKVKMDSIHVTKIHPIFSMGDGQYAKVEYSMVMYMDFSPAENEVGDSAQNKLVEKSMATKYGDENVSLDSAGVLKIRTGTPMVAVKDKYAKEWSFVSLKDDDPMIHKLFTQEVLDKLATYQ